MSLHRKNIKSRDCKYITVFIKFKVTAIQFEISKLPLLGKIAYILDIKTFCIQFSDR